MNLMYLPVRLLMLVSNFLIRLLIWAKELPTFRKVCYWWPYQTLIKSRARSFDLLETYLTISRKAKYSASSKLFWFSWPFIVSASFSSKKFSAVYPISWMSSLTYFALSLNTSFYKVLSSLTL